MKIIFTKHSERRIKKRGILREEIIHSVKYPDKSIKKHSMHYYQKKLENGVIEIVCEKTEINKFLNLNQKIKKKGKILKIITVYWI